jgi:acetyl esterase/lipase
MLDDRNGAVSSMQYVEEGTWSQANNFMAWKCLLRESHDQVSIYAAPSLTSDLSGLPPAFINVRSSEVFRDEAVAYASRLWECGVQAELHVWPGAFHAFDLLAPTAALSIAARKRREDRIRRTFTPGISGSMQLKAQVQ